MGIQTQQNKGDEPKEPKTEKSEEKSTEEKPKSEKPKGKSSKDVTQAAQDCLDGKYGSGRERDLELAKAGFDPEEVRKEFYRLRAELSA